jgi:hypothetical protein
MPWYWDTIDPNNDYFLIQAAADFVTASGLADQDNLKKSSPRTAVPGGSVSSLVFAPSGGFGTNMGPDTFIVGGAAPDGIGLATAYLQGNGNRSLLTNGYTFFVNYPSSGTFTVRISQIAKAGAIFQVFIDGIVMTNRSFAPTANDLNTNLNTQFFVSAGIHTIKLYNPGADWLKLGNITLNPYVFQLAAYAIGNTNFAAMWLWDRTNVFSATPGTALNGTVDVAGLNTGTYTATWWDTFGAGAISNFTFTVTGPNVPVTLTTPPIFRSIALYILPSPSPLSTWRQTHFGTSQNSGNAADTADPDHDGIINILEYAFGLDPNSPNPNPISFAPVGDHLTITFKRPHPAPADLVYTPQVAGDLSSGIWNSGPSYTSQTVTDNGDGTETVVVTDLAPMSSTPVHFLRILIVPQ